MKSWPTGHTYNEKVNALEFSPASSLLSIAVWFVFFFFKVVVGITVSKNKTKQNMAVSVHLSSVRNTTVTN